MPSSVWLKFKQLIAPPAFEGDEEKTRAAAFLNALLWASLATQIFSPIVYAGKLERGIICVAAWTAMIVSAHWLLRRGSVRAASIMAITVAWVLVNLITASSGGIRANGFSGCLIVAGCAGMLLGWRAMVTVVVASIFSGLAIMLLEKYEIIHPEPMTLFAEWMTYTMVFFVAALQLGLFITDIRTAMQRVRKELTERKRTEQALVESEERYRSLVENAPEAILVLDADTGKFVDSNTNAGKLFGVTREELLNSGPEDYSPPKQPNGKDSLELGRTKMKEALESGFAYFDWIHRDKSGREISCEVRLARMPSTSRRLVRGTIMDVTARKRLEAHLLQAQKMESIGLLAGGVAHDFNNLLAVILSSTELMALKPECAPAKPHIGDIRNAASRAAQLTRQLLAFSRKQILQPSVINLNLVIIETEKMLRRLIGAHIEMRMDLAPDAFPVLVDRGQIEQVLLNLAVNARDAMPNGGTLTLTTRNVSSGSGSQLDTPVPARPSLVLEVSDTGTGMDENTKSHLFEPFFTTKDVGQGTGLGLSTVHGIVKQSGGHISVESRKGQGTTFRIYLPRTDETYSRRATPPAEKMPTKGTETILLAEDNDLALNVAARSLETFGYKVLKAETPAVAIELAKSYDGKIDLLLTDVIMPKMNGRQLAREVKVSRPGIRTLFTSGYARDVIVHQGVLEEGIELLEKPFTPERLAQRVRSVLDVGRTEQRVG